MTRPRTLPLLAALGALAAALAFVLRGLGRRRERVDLYFDDGSLLSLEDGAQAARLLEIARSAL
jgi:hypothetical protein